MLRTPSETFVVLQYMRPLKILFRNLATHTAKPESEGKVGTRCNQRNKYVQLPQGKKEGPIFYTEHFQCTRYNTALLPAAVRFTHVHLAVRNFRFYS
jgi:hypothetical protein